MKLLTSACVVLFVTLASISPSSAQNAAPATELPVVWVFSTGGTIAGRGTSSTNLAEYQSGAVPGAELVAAVPEIAKLAAVKVEQIANVNSSDITITHWLTLARRINEVFADPKVAGVVVTHGTNTIEETAYFLNLTIKDERPVVLVGSMRPATAISADGPLNLLNAVRTATSREARGKGALVVLNEEINAAREVTKTNTYRVETFKSPELGLLGYVDSDKVAFYRTSTKRHTTQSEFDVRTLKSLPQVDIVYSYADATPVVAQALVKSGAKGLVFAGTGAGLLSTREREAVKPFLSMPADTRPVLVRSSRPGNGRVIALADYEPLQMIPADNLNPQKARILLMLALTQTHDLKEIARIFSEY